MQWVEVDQRRSGGHRRLLKELLAGQRADGGWAQTSELASDAYATGETLYVLHELGVAIQPGVSGAWATWCVTSE